MSRSKFLNQNQHPNSQTSQEKERKFSIPKLESPRTQWRGGGGGGPKPSPLKPHSDPKPSSSSSPAASPPPLFLLPAASFPSPPAPMAPTVLMVSSTSRSAPGVPRGVAAAVGGGRSDPGGLSAPHRCSRPHSRIAASAGRGEAQHRALHRLRPLRRPRKSPTPAR